MDPNRSRQAEVRFVVLVVVLLTLLIRTMVGGVSASSAAPLPQEQGSTSDRTDDR